MDWISVVDTRYQDDALDKNDRLDDSNGLDEGDELGHRGGLDQGDGVAR